MKKFVLLLLICWGWLRAETPDRFNVGPQTLERLQSDPRFSSRLAQLEKAFEYVAAIPPQFYEKLGQTIGDMNYGRNLHCVYWILNYRQIPWLARFDRPRARLLADVAQDFEPALDPEVLETLLPPVENYPYADWSKPNSVAQVHVMTTIRVFLTREYEPIKLDYANHLAEKYMATKAGKHNRKGIFAHYRREITFKQFSSTIQRDFLVFKFFNQITVNLAILTSNTDKLRHKAEAFALKNHYTNERVRDVFVRLMVEAVGNGSAGKIYFYRTPAQIKQDLVDFLFAEVRAMQNLLAAEEALAKALVPLSPFTGSGSAKRAPSARPFRIATAIEDEGPVFETPPSGFVVVRNAELELAIAGLRLGDEIQVIDRVIGELSQNPLSRSTLVHDSAERFGTRIFAAYVMGGRYQILWSYGTKRGTIDVITVAATLR